MKEDDIVCVDVGQHQMWTAQSLETRGKQHILFSGGMGAMGFALPAAIGASLGMRKRSIVIVGDGGVTDEYSGTRSYQKKKASHQDICLQQCQLRTGKTPAGAV